ALLAFHRARDPASVHQHLDVALECEGTAGAVLRMLWSEANDAAIAVDVGPRQREDLAAAPAGEIPEARDVVEVPRQMPHDRIVFGGFEESLPRIVFAKALDLGDTR